MAFFKVRATIGTRRAACLLLGMVVTAGCGSGSPFHYVKVHGTVLYEDGTAIPFTGETRLVFESQAPPINETIHPRPAIAYLATDGSFQTVTSHKYGDGLVRGEHKVILGATDAEGNVLIPAEYGDISTTPLLVSTNDSPLLIKIRKP